MRVLYSCGGVLRIPPGSGHGGLWATSRKSLLLWQERPISAHWSWIPLCFWALFVTFHNGGQFSSPVDHLQKVEVSC